MEQTGCIDCVHVKEFLDSKKVQYQYIDISKNNEALLYTAWLIEVERVIPTLIVNGLHMLILELKLKIN